jgi:hypothetical protein
MTLPSRRNGLAAVACTLALLLGLTTGGAARASAGDPDGTPDPGGDRIQDPGGAGAVRRPGLGTLDLSLRAESARLALAGEGAAQESDTEKPKAIDEPRVTVTKGDGSAAAPAQQQTRGDPNKFKFLKEWPFWVIVGGVVIAGIATVMIVRNANQEAPCNPSFTSGCFGEK